MQWPLHAVSFNVITIIIICDIRYNVYVIILEFPNPLYYLTLMCKCYAIN